MDPIAELQAEFARFKESFNRLLAENERLRVENRRLRERPFDLGQYTNDLLAVVSSVQG